MGEVLHFLLWSSKEPVAWVRERSGLVPWLPVCHKPATASCSWRPDTLITIQAGSERWWGREAGKGLGCERTRDLFSGHDRFHNLKTYFTFYCAHLFLAIIKMSLSSGRLGSVTMFPSQGITYGNNPRHAATSNPLCLGNALEYLGWKVQFLLEREPPKWVCLKKSPRARWASQTSVKQVLWLTERCGGNRCP